MFLIVEHTNFVFAFFGRYFSTSIWSCPDKLFTSTRYGDNGSYWEYSWIKISRSFCIHSVIWWEGFFPKRIVPRQIWLNQTNVESERGEKLVGEMDHWWHLNCAIAYLILNGIRNWLDWLFFCMLTLSFVSFVSDLIKLVDFVISVSYIRGKHSRQRSFFCHFFYSFWSSSSWPSSLIVK